MSCPAGYRLVRATAADHDRVEALARTAFYPDEALSVALGNVSGPASAEDMRFLQALPGGWSFIVEEEHTGRAVAFCINSEISPEIQEKKSLFEPGDERVGALMSVVRAAWRAADVWSQTAARSGLEVRVLAVEPAHRGRGLGGCLLRAALDLARRELRLPVALVLATSAYTARIAAAAGMRLLYRLHYQHAGLPSLPPPPHTELTIYIVDLQ